MRSIVPYQSLVNLYMTMTEPYFRYCDIIWGQFNETLKNKLSETAFLLLKGINLSVGQKSSQYQDQNFGLKNPLILEMYHRIECVIGKTSIPNINSLAST